jgi:hypothetical protein
MESRIVKIVRIEFEEPMAELNEPHIGLRYLYAHKKWADDLREGRVLEVSQSGAWIKLFDGREAEWIHVEQFEVFERLDLVAR